MFLDNMFLYATQTVSSKCLLKLIKYTLYQYILSIILHITVQLTISYINFESCVFQMYFPKHDQNHTNVMDLKLQLN